MSGCTELRDVFRVITVMVGVLYVNGLLTLSGLTSFASRE